MLFVFNINELVIIYIILNFKLINELHVSNRVIRLLIRLCFNLVILTHLLFVSYSD